MNSAVECVASINVTVLGWLHTSLQFLPVTLPVLMALYDTLHPSCTPTSDSEVGCHLESVGSTQHFLFVPSSSQEKFCRHSSLPLDGNVRVLGLVDHKTPHSHTVDR
jgi:hypothetical protein